jgi:hypothetical protein
VILGFKDLGGGSGGVGAMAVRAAAGWEMYADAEAAALAELDLKVGVVGGGDRADDGQP